MCYLVFHFIHTPMIKTNKPCDFMYHVINALPYILHIKLFFFIILMVLIQLDFHIRFLTFKFSKVTNKANHKWFLYILHVK